jgi:hypothetical protein
MTENYCNVSVGRLDGRDHVGDLGVDGAVILKWILKEQDNYARPEMRYSSEGGNEDLGSISTGIFLTS